MTSFRTIVGLTAAALLSMPTLATAGGPTAGDCGSQKTYTTKAPDLVETAQSAGQFKTLLAAAKAAGLVDTLKSDGPFTVFAPSDAAFAKLPKGTVEGLLKDKEKLKSILLYHVVSGEVLAKQATKLKTAKTVQGSAIKLAVVDGALRVNDATVVGADVKASNGVIHIIDTVILPSGKKSASR